MIEFAADISFLTTVVNSYVVCIHLALDRASKATPMQILLKPVGWQQIACAWRKLRYSCLFVEAAAFLESKIAFLTIRATMRGRK